MLAITKHNRATNLFALELMPVHNERPCGLDLRQGQHALQAAAGTNLRLRIIFLGGSII
jgi:hypothetical protein